MSGSTLSMDVVVTEMAVEGTSTEGLGAIILSEFGVGVGAGATGTGGGMNKFEGKAPRKRKGSTVVLCGGV